MMIKDLNIPGTDLWKYVDDSTTSETLKKSEASGIQQAVDELTTQTSGDKFQLNETKAWFKRRILHAPNRIAKLNACKMRRLNSLRVNVRKNRTTGGKP